MPSAVDASGDHLVELTTHSTAFLLPSALFISSTWRCRKIAFPPRGAVLLPICLPAAYPYDPYNGGVMWFFLGFIGREVGQDIC
ncbi:hypothetical protein BDZ85DRAFT_268051 [Elsinoe ampelina]|uniref:Uncharacterized protein n=1 Tax=Elsinoe ampelina TaxID=302913 RepID=A0A6A6G1L5_9PEZI|nr:hypothetical protein BDZ85DRAFT_268051 [Elsinoe ampelina]